MKMTTKKGNWNIHGINLISSDEIYKKIKFAIEEGTATQKYLQTVTGHLAPITVDIPSRTITFRSF